MTQNPKEKTLKNKEREKGLKPKIHDKDSVKDLLSYIKKTLNQNKAVDITEIMVDQSFSEFEKILIASGSSKRQVIALAEKVQEGVKGLFRINCKVEGKENADWVLLDFGAVIVHIFKPVLSYYLMIVKIWKVPLKHMYIFFYNIHNYIG